MQQLEDVEVEEIEAVAAFADEEDGAPGEDRRNGVGATETEDQGSENRSHETAVH